MTNVESQIIDDDGSCRDINFPDVTSPKAIALLELIKSFCTLDDASNNTGDKLDVSQLENSIASLPSDSITSRWSSSRLIKHLQLFFSWDNADKVFIEITFFPNDVDRQSFSLVAFQDWLGPILKSLDTTEYYVRYENASWKYGDTGKYSGVIISNASTARSG